jgi:hypothetical protein
LFSGERNVCHFVDGAEEGHQGEGDVDDGDAADEDGSPSCVWFHRFEGDSQYCGGAGVMLDRGACMSDGASLTS